MAGVRQVVVGVSGSPGSIVALRSAGRHARRDDVPLIAVHAWLPPGGDLADRRSPAPPELKAVWKRAALDRLTAAIDLAWGGLPGDVRIEHVITRGPAGPVLLSIADDPDDLLVIGAGNRITATRPWRGRVARYCETRATCQVLAVPPPALPSRRHLTGWPLRRGELTADQVLNHSEKLGPNSR